MMTSVEWALEPFSSFWINYLQRYVYEGTCVCWILYVKDDPITYSFNTDIYWDDLHMFIYPASFVCWSPGSYGQVLWFQQDSKCWDKIQVYGTTSIGNTTVMFSESLTACIYWPAKHKLVSIMLHLIWCRWFRLCLRGKWSAAYPLVTELLSNEGRMKYIVPLYR